MMARGAVVGADVDIDSQPTKIFNAGQRFRRPGTVTKRDSLWSRRFPRRLAVALAAQVFGGQRQKRRLADAAGNHNQMIGRLRRKSVPKRTPHVKHLPWR